MVAKLVCTDDDFGSYRNHFVIGNIPSSYHICLLFHVFIFFCFFLTLCASANVVQLEALCL